LLTSQGKTHQSQVRKCSKKARHKISTFLCTYLKVIQWALGFYNRNRNEAKQQKLNRQYYAQIGIGLWNPTIINHKGGVDHHHHIMAFLLPWDNVGTLTTMVKIRNVLWSSQKIWWTCHSSLQQLVNIPWGVGPNENYLRHSFESLPFRQKPITIIIRIIIIITHPKWPTQHTYVKILTKRQNHKMSRRVLELKTQVDN
jgi:hypothetical protein